MKVMRLLGVLLLLLAMVPLAAQQGNGTLKVRVQLEDGTPCPGVEVHIRQDTVTHSIGTGEDGSLTYSLPPGDVVVDIPGAPTPATLTAGQTTEVTITLKPDHGIIVTTAFPDGTPLISGVSAAYRAPEGDKQNLRGVRVGKGRYWLPDVPPTATALCIITGYGGPWLPAAHRVQWTFTDTPVLRALTTTVPAMVPVVLRVEKDGQPLASTQLTCTSAYPFPRWGNYWENVADLPKGRQMTYWNLVTTDAEGRLDLGLFPVGACQLTLKEGELSGPTVPLTVAADGTVTPTTYKLIATNRRITQTVFDTAGQPVPEANVTITYSWGGKLIYRQATADAQGQVTWDDVPPVRAITFGPRIAAGVIAADADAVTQPLPAPVMDDTCTFDINIRITRTDPTPVEVNTLFLHGGWPQETTLNIANGGHGWHLHDGHPGEKVTILHLYRTDPPQFAGMLDGYLPYADQGQTNIEFDASALPQYPAVAIAGSLVSTTGQPVYGVSNLRMEPVEVPARFRALVNDPRLPAWVRGLFIPRPNGAFTAVSLCPGTYQLYFDLFDETVPPGAGMRFEATPGENRVTVRLPAPLATVPGGTVVHWLTQNAPATVRELTVPAYADAMPFYGPAEGLRACWYSPKPNTLMLWDADDAKWQTIPLQSVLFSPQNPQYVSQMGTFRLLPFLPAPGDGARAGTPFQAEELSQLNLWVGRYFYTRDAAENAIAGMVRVKKLTAMESTLLPATLSPAGWKRTASTHLVRLRFPKQPVLPGPSTRSRPVLFNFGEAFAALTQECQFDAVNDVWVPNGAKTMTLYCPGVGVLRDAAIPTAETDVPQGVLPDFAPGVTLTLTLPPRTGDAPRELACAPLQTLGVGWQITQRVPVTDDKPVALPHLAPGRWAVSLPVNGARYSWILDVPDRDTAVTLTAPHDPVYVAFVGTNGTGVTIWWLPRDGAPRRLMAEGRDIFPTDGSITLPPLPSTAQPPYPVYREIASADLPAGEGSLWVVEDATGTAQVMTATLAPGLNLLAPAASTPTLGIELPLYEQVGMPGALTLTGTGARAGVSVTITRPNWRPIPALGIFTVQLPAPPGDYTVTVHTATGLVSAPVTIGDTGGHVVMKP